MDWIKQLRVGDEVATRMQGTYWGAPTIVKVEKVTPSGRIIAGGRTYGTDGVERSSCRNRNQIQQLDAPTREKIERHEKAESLGRVNWLAVEIGALRVAYNAVKLPPASPDAGRGEMGR